MIADRTRETGTAAASAACFRFISEGDVVVRIGGRQIRLHTGSRLLFFFPELQAEELQAGALGDVHPSAYPVFHSVDLAASVELRMVLGLAFLRSEERTTVVFRFVHRSQFCGLIKPVIILTVEGSLKSLKLFLVLLYSGLRKSIQVDSTSVSMSAGTCMKCTESNCL